jgi:HEAT repeat protein
VDDIERLKQVLRDESYDNAEMAVTALEAVGEEGKAALRDLAWAERNPAGAYYVAREGDDRGRAILVECLQEGGPRRADAAEFLRDLKDARCIPFFAPMLRTTTHWRGAFIALELGKIGTPEAIKLLIECLSRDSLHVRRGAVRGLAEAKDPDAIQPLIQLLIADEDSKVRRLADQALVAIGTEAVAPLRAYLAEWDVQGRQRRKRIEQVLQKLGTEV